MNRNWRKHLTIDAMILVIACFMLVISLVLFFADGYFFGSDSHNNLVAVGKFDFSRNDVRRRVDTGLTWNGVSSPDIVYEGDSVFTGDESEASVTLANGSVIKIDPKSLVVIRTRGTQTEIDLQYGSLQGKVAGEGIVLTQNGQSQELSGVDAEIRIVKTERSKETKVQVMKGEVKIAGQSASAKQDEVLHFDASSKATVKKAPVTLISPVSGETRWVPIDATVPFKWKSTNAGEHRIEFSRSTNFSAPLFSASTQSSEYQLAESNRPDGAFYWRVAPQDGEASLPSRLSVFPDVPPLPTLPTEGQTYWIDKEGESLKPIYFTWEDKVGSTSWKIQVARDESFKDIVYENDSKSTVDRTRLAPGSYIYRILGENPARKNPPWSRLVAFSVKAGAKGPKVPEFVDQRISYEIPRSTFKGMKKAELKKIHSVKPEGLKPFAWSTVEGAESYEIEVAPDDTFKSAVKHETSELRFAPQEVRPGPVFARVRAKGEGGRWSAMSEPARLDVMLPSPNLASIPAQKSVFKTEKELEAAKHEFKLAWSTTPWAAGYELQWGADAEFAKSKKFSLLETKRAITVSKGMDYYARVRALGADGQPLSAYSETKIASYKKELFVAPLALAKPKPKPLPAVAPTPAPRAPAAKDDVGGLVRSIPIPRLREPRPETSLISLENAPTFVSFRWNAFKDASYYTIQIASDADFTKVIEMKKVLKTAFVFEKPLPEGRVFWRVRAHTKAGYSEWSDPADLNVLYQ